ncbi:MAG: MMPL family transporter [Clostridiales bacterium]|nr:MMPL family transporter [Clostridiales bacterium]
MLPRFSVRKPYTALVGVILVIVLGIVSYLKMSADLLPDMDLPYTIVMTPYPGASPEEVELAVSRPVESSMATISNIDNVQSVSSQNMSLVILEFKETANMDSVTIEMREKLDQIASYWPDKIGKPSILKINPDMLPIMVAALGHNELNRSELTTFVNQNIIPEIESIEGVASVTSTGELEESIHVIIQEDKINKVNEDIRLALNKSFTEAEDEITKGKEELEKAKEELEKGKATASEEMSKGKTALQEAQSEITKAEIEINLGLAEIEAQKTQMATIVRVLVKIQELFEQLNDKNDELQQIKASLLTAKEEIEKIEEKKADLGELSQEIAASLNTLDITQEQEHLERLNAIFLEANKYLDEIQKIIEEEYGFSITEFNDLLEVHALHPTDLSGSYADLSNKLGELKNNMSLESDIDSILDIIDKLSDFITKGKETVGSTINELNENKGKLDQGAKALEVAKDEIISGKATVNQAFEELNKNEFLAAIEFSTGTSKINLAQEELDKAMEEFELTKEETLENTKVGNFITSEMVEGILAAQNFNMPAGYVTEDGVSYLVRVGDKFEEVEDISNLVLFDPEIPDLEPIKLSDIADVVQTDNSDQIYAVVNGEDGLLLQVQKQTGYSTGDVSDDINAKFAELENEHEGLELLPLMDQGVYIDIITDSIIESIISGGILAIIVLLIFLKDIKPTIVVALSIPVSLIGAIAAMYFTGVSINIISLAGLALGVGMLVDNSIVVIENIYRLRTEGMPAREAAIQGASQVSGAIIASILTTVCVFLPIVFTEGITRQLFVDMGLTVAYSLIASLVVALTVVPAMSAGMLKNIGEKEHKIYDRIANAYRKLLSKVLEHKVITIALSVVIFVISIFAAFSRGTMLFPEMESPQVMINLQTEENTPLQETAQLSNEFIARIADIEDISGIGAMTSSLSLMGINSGEADNNDVSIYVLLKEDKELSNAELEDLIISKTNDLDVKIDIQTQAMDTSALGGSGIQIEIRGRDLDVLQEQGKNIAALISTIDGTTNVSDGLEDAKPEFRIVINKEEAASYNLTVAQVFGELNAILRERTATTTLSTDTYDHGIIVEDLKNQSLIRNDLENLDINYTKLDGTKASVKLSEIANFEEGQSPSSISRKDGQRYIAVSAELESGYNIGLVGDEVREVLKDYQMPAGYTYVISGEDEAINEAFGQLSLMMLLAVIFIYLIMVAQFQSLLSPFIVMFTIPLAFTGGFLALFATRQEVSIIALIGFLLLAGIIVNNGIVLVDYINQLRLAGSDKKEAIVTAARTRLKPILMTALTTILGLMPLSLGIGIGTEVIQPMGIVVVGGLTYGTLLTLFIIPCFYDVFNRK